MHHNHRCVTSTGDLFHTHCKPRNLNATMDISTANQYFTASGKVQVQCGQESWDLEEWQAKGYDVGSNVSKLPTADEAVQWGKDLLMK